jgi:hypothetical protein
MTHPYPKNGRSKIKEKSLSQNYIKVKFLFEDKNTDLLVNWVEINNG